MSIEKLQHRLGQMRQRLLEIYTSIAHTIVEIDQMAIEANQLSPLLPVEEKIKTKRKYKNVKIKIKRVHSLSEIKEMLEAHKTISVKEICDKYKISDPTWYQWRKRYGVYGKKIKLHAMEDK